MAFRLEVEVPLPFIKRRVRESELSLPARKQLDLSTYKQTAFLREENEDITRCWATLS